MGGGGWGLTWGVRGELRIGICANRKPTQDFPIPLITKFCSIRRRLAAIPRSSCDPWASLWGTPTDPSAAMVSHGLLSSAMCSNGNNDWHVHSLMLSLRDLRGLPLRRPRRRCFPSSRLSGHAWRERSRCQVVC